MSTPAWEERVYVNPDTGEVRGEVHANSRFVAYKNNDDGPEGEQGQPEDMKDAKDLLNDTYEKICIKSAQESRRMADSKCVDAMCMICDGMKLVYEQMDGLKMFRCGEEFVKLAAEMTAMGDSIAKIRTSMESEPRIAGWGAV